MAELFVVATPIGNLSDITFRAVEILKNVDVIACEDTRNTSTLCEKYDIKTRLISYHKYSENRRVDLFLEYLKQGKNVALVSDAGTPLISDPGNILVKEVKKQGFKVTPIVGACAVIGLLSAIEREGEDFKFIGFLPKNDTQIKEIVSKNKCENFVFYESPNRILKTLKAISEVNPSLDIAVGRELTKKFEEINSGRVDEILKYYSSKDKIKGEFVVLVRANKEKTDEAQIREDIEKLKKLKLTNKDISNILFEIKGYNKNLVKSLI